MVIRAFKEWLVRAKSGQVRMPGLFWLSTAEATFLPVPLELILFPVMQLNRDKAWRIALWVTLGSLFGSLLLYGLAYWAMEAIGIRAIEWMGWQAQLAEFNQLFDSYGFWAIVGAGILPIPIQVAILAAGAASYSVPLLLIAIALSRALRYFGIAWLVLRYGDRAQETFRASKLKFVLVGMALLGVIWITMVSLECLISYV